MQPYLKSKHKFLKPEILNSGLPVHVKVFYLPTDAQ